MANMAYAPGGGSLAFTVDLSKLSFEFDAIRPWGQGGGGDASIARA
jgi:hypothetical protein